MNYNKNHLNYKPIFTKEETKQLDKINEILSLQKFLANDNKLDKAL